MTAALDRTDTLAGRLFGAALGALEVYSVYLGAELGLYRALDERGPLVSGELAEAGGAPEGLTPREREGGGLVAEGRTNRQIGAQLHLSAKTVEKHVSSAIAKLDVSSRTGIARLVERDRAGLRG